MTEPEERQLLERLRESGRAVAERGDAADTLRDELVREDVATAGYVTIERLRDQRLVTLAQRLSGPAGSVALDLPDGTLVHVDRAVRGRICGVTISVDEHGAVPPDTTAVLRALFGIDVAVAFDGDSEIALARDDPKASREVRAPLARLAVVDAELRDRYAEGTAASGLWHAEAAAALRDLPDAIGLAAERVTRARAGAEALADLGTPLAELDWRVLFHAQELAQAIVGVLGESSVPARVAELASVPREGPRLERPRRRRVDADLVVTMGTVGTEGIAIQLEGRLVRRYALTTDAAEIKIVGGVPTLALVSDDTDPSLFELWARAFRVEDEAWSLIGVAPFVVDASGRAAVARLGLSEAEISDPHLRFDVTDSPSRPHRDSPLGRHFAARSYAARAARAAADGEVAAARQLWQLAAEAWHDIGDDLRARLALLAATDDPRIADAQELKKAFFGADGYVPPEITLPELLGDEDGPDIVRPASRE